MKIFKVVMMPVSSYTSPIHSDTLFGAFCWAYKYKYGEDLLTKLLKQYKSNDPAIIFSNVFPEGLLPFPMVPISFKVMEADAPKSEKLIQYRKQKKIKKLEYLTEENFNLLINGTLRVSKIGKNQKEVVNYGNLVNRVSNTVGDNEEIGGLYERKEVYPMGRLAFYAKVKLGWEDIFQEVVSLMGTMGLGADKSIGKGIFDIENVGPCEIFKVPKNPNGFVVLSNYIPTENDPTRGYYKTMVKYGKLDREYASTDKPFKKPLVMLTEGSVFYTDEVKMYYGRVIGDVSNLNRNIIHNGIAFTIPMIINN